MQELICFRMKDLPPSYVILKKENQTNYHVYKYFPGTVEEYRHWDYIDGCDTKEISSLLSYKDLPVNEQQRNVLYSIFERIDSSELPSVIKREVGIQNQL